MSSTFEWTSSARISEKENDASISTTISAGICAPIEDKIKTSSDIPRANPQDDFVYLATIPAPARDNAISRGTQVSCSSSTDKNSLFDTRVTLTRDHQAGGPHRYREPRSILISTVNATQQARNPTLFFEPNLGYQLSPFCSSARDKRGSLTALCRNSVCDRAGPWTVRTEIRAYSCREYWSIRACCKGLERTAASSTSALLTKRRERPRAELKNEEHTRCKFQQSVPQADHRRQYQARQEKTHRRTTVSSPRRFTGGQPQHEHDAQRRHDEHRAGARRSIASRGE